MTHDENNLWQGGLWERENPQYPSPPPVVVPPPSAYAYQPCETTEPKLSGKAKLGFGSLVTLIAGLLILSVYLGTKEGAGITWELPSIPSVFGENENRRVVIDPLENVSIPPTISKAERNEEMEVAFIEPFTTSPLTSGEIYQKCLPSIVFIEAESFRQYGTGTGVVLSEDGYIITNAHVIEGASRALVTLWDNQRYEASLVAYSFEQDLAVLKIDVEGLTPAEFVDSDTLMVGDTSYAMGNPLGSEYRSTFTNGMVSAIDRALSVDNVSLLFVQTTTAINSGNSGGALINEYGQVVGITTIKIMSEDDTIEGMGFAIPSKRMKVVVDRLFRGEDMAVAMIGIEVGSVKEPVVGLLVSKVNKGTKIEEAGMLSGDIILEANGKPIQSATDLNAVKGYLFAGEEISYVVYRDGEEIEITAALDSVDDV